MKSKFFLVITTLIFVNSIQAAQSQNIRGFPFDPYVILKSWNYDFLVKTMGNGEEILATSKNQTYLAGLRYPSDLLGMRGIMEFTFVKDSIASFRFRNDHEFRVTSADLADKKNRDPTVNQEYNRAIQKLDSIQKRDSLGRDSVVRAISEILGPPLSNSRTAITEKNARHSAIWINRGYSCLFKDYSNYSEIVFALPTVPLWVVGEFDISAGTEILQKTMVNTKKMSWSASLLGFPSDASKMIYSDLFLLLEFAAGQRYLQSVPKNAICYLQTLFVLEFASGQRCLMSIPKNAIGYLPRLIFEDCDGDAIPEAWIQVPADIDGKQTRHYLFSLQLKEPNLIFSSDDLFPSCISNSNGSQIIVTFRDGTTRSVEIPKALDMLNSTVQLNPKGFRYFNTSKLNYDGSTNFIGGIELNPSKGKTGIDILEITYKHSTGGWETDQIKLVRRDQ